MNNDPSAASTKSDRFHWSTITSPDLRSLRIERPGQTSSIFNWDLLYHLLGLTMLWVFISVCDTNPLGQSHNEMLQKGREILSASLLVAEKKTNQGVGNGSTYISARYGCYFICSRNPTLNRPTLERFLSANLRFFCFV